MPEPEAPSLRRRLLRASAGAASALALTEIGAALVHLVLAQQCFSYAAAEERRAQIQAVEAAPHTGPESPQPDWMQNEVVHPYAGYLRRPAPETDDARAPWPHAAPLFDDSQRDPLRVVVVGGSVAEQVGGELHAALLAAGAPPERLRTVVFAIGGAKQPQQLALLSYLMALGAQMEAVVNLDGFNEAVLPVAENWADGVYAHYPRSWHRRFADADDPSLTRAIGRVTVLREDRAQMAGWFGGTPLRFSVFANVLWMAWDADRSRRVASAREALGEAMRAATRSYQMYGPQPSMSAAEVFADSARVWARSSVLIDELAQQRGFTYLHVLQPNQYLRGTKPLSDEERERYVRVDSPYGRYVGAGYAALRREEPTLRAAGVRYLDLTRIFEDDAETRYEDDCCHFDMPARQILAARVAEELLGALGEAPPERAPEPSPPRE